MADPFVAEIRIFPFNFAPKGWAWCDGQLVPIVAEHGAVFVAGDDLRGRWKVELRASRPSGPRADAPGAGSWTFSTRSRRDRGLRDGDASPVRDPGAHARDACILRRWRSQDSDVEPVHWRAPSVRFAYQSTTTGLQAMAPETLPPAGGDQPHNNLQPYLTFFFCIALQGVFPPRS